MVFDYDNFVFLANQLTLLDKEARRVYFSCGNSIQLNDEEFKKVLAQVKEKYEVPQVVRDKPVSAGNTANKPKRIPK
jgi:hypothetical protein